MRTCLAGFLPDVATTFGGLWQPARLRAGTAFLVDPLLDPDPTTGQLRVRCGAKGLEQGLAGHAWEIAVFEGEKPATVATFPCQAGTSLDTILAVPDPELWSPEQPSVYRVAIRLLQNGQVLAEKSLRTGFRSLSAQGGKLLFNEQPVFLRGVLSWGWDPKRIAPAYSPDQARQEFRRIKSLGFSLVKLCLFVPNQAYYDAADEEGIFLWQEWPMWLPEISAEERRRLPGDYAELMRLARHHPAVIVYSLGCELGGSVDAELLGQLNQTARSLASGALFCDNSGSGESYGGLETDFSDFSDYHPYLDLHYFEPLLDHWRRDWLPPRPWIFGEFCDCDDFRIHPEIIAANRGDTPWWMTAENPVVAWRPEALAMVEKAQRMKRACLPFTEEAIQKTAYAQSGVVRKYTLEAVRRRRWRHGGDRPDRIDPYNLWAGEPARWRIILHHTLSRLISGGELAWQLHDSHGQIVREGQERVDTDFPGGVPRQITAVDCILPEVPGAGEFRLEAHFFTAKSEITNTWPVWVYPWPKDWPSAAGLHDPSGVLEGLDDLAQLGLPLRMEVGALDAPVVIATALDKRMQTYLESGGKVLLLQQSLGPLPARHGSFWREAIKLFPPHPLWERFPQRGYADLQFFGLATDVMLDASRLGEAIPNVKGAQAVMQRLDAREFHVHEYLLEAEVGKGRLLACSLHLQGDAGAQPSGFHRNVAGVYLLWAMLDSLR